MKTITSSFLVTGVRVDFCLKARDGTYRHPTSCAQYVVCANNQAIVKQCPPGLHYSLDYNICDYPVNVACRLHDEQPHKNTPPVSPPHPGPVHSPQPTHPRSPHPTPAPQPVQHKDPTPSFHEEAHRPQMFDTVHTAVPEPHKVIVYAGNDLDAFGE